MLLTYCPNCGENISNERIEVDIARKIMKIKPEASILNYGKF